MNAAWLRRQGVVLGIFGALGVTWALRAEPSGDEKLAANGGDQAAAKEEISDEHRVSVEVARDRAKLMFDIYAASLDMMHHRYFHGDRAVVPASALEDVFSEIKRQSSVEARWIAVNMEAMNVDNKPQSEFEKTAAKEIADGKTDVERVEQGYYRRAGAIPLTAGCVSCHGGFFKPQSKKPRFAALVISVPIKAEGTPAKAAAQ